jgi:hypothetical protein
MPRNQSMSDWHWDGRSGRRVPTNRRAHLADLAGRVPAGVFLWVGALALWGWGVVKFVTGSYYLGGTFIFAAGLLLIIWAGGGWRRFRAAVADGSADLVRPRLGLEQRF